MQQCIDIFYCKVGVLDDSKHTKVKNQTKNQKFPGTLMVSIYFCFFNKKSHQPGDKGGKKNKDNITRTACNIIDVAESKKNDPLKSVGNKIKDKYTCRHKKDKQVGY